MSILILVSDECETVKVPHIKILMSVVNVWIPNSGLKGQLSVTFLEILPYLLYIT